MENNPCLYFGTNVNLDMEHVNTNCWSIYKIIYIFKETNKKFGFERILYRIFFIRNFVDIKFVSVRIVKKSDNTLDRYMSSDELHDNAAFHDKEPIFTSKTETHKSWSNIRYWMLILCEDATLSSSKRRLLTSNEQCQANILIPVSVHLVYPRKQATSAHPTHCITFVSCAVAQTPCLIWRFQT